MKIKKVVIEGFRAYQTKNDGTFDFTAKDGGCSNFVSIYAPNGFGKTSFYDAVEWALTNNIDRFVRDSARIDNDNISKSQNREKHRQYILRNRAIAEDAPSQVTVVGDTFELTKEVPRAKAGSRDFLFKKEPTELGMEDVPGVFLSQEAIDGFLREERPESRYARFMKHFGDGDETYRESLLALKRELAIELGQINQEQARLEVILKAPVDSKIYETINSAIGDLVRVGESIPSLSEEFNPDNERLLRNTITQRLTETRSLIEDSERYLKLLEEALNDVSSIAATVYARDAAARDIARLRERRVRLEQYLALRRNAEVATVAFDVDQAEYRYWQSLQEKLSTFQELLITIEDALKGSKAAETRLAAATEEAASCDQRILECRRRLQEHDAEVAKLSELQKKAPVTYEEINALEAEARATTTKQEQYRLQIDSLTSKIGLARTALATVDLLEISEDAVNTVDLTPLRDRGLAQTELLAAIFEKRNSAEQLHASTRVLDALQLQKDQLSSLIALGAEYLSESNSSQCPLCTHDHPSHEALLQNILNHPGLSTAESSALEARNLAQAAFTEASKTVQHLLGKWRELKATVIQQSRESLAKDEADLRALTEKSKQLGGTLSVIASRLEQYKKDVLNISATELFEYIAQRLGGLAKQRSAEDSDLKGSESRLMQKKQEIKNEIQINASFKEKVARARSNSTFVEITSLCGLSNPSFDQVEKFVSNYLHESLMRATKAAEIQASARQELGEFKNQNPGVQIDQISKLEIDEQLAATANLKAEAILSAFLSRIVSHLSGYRSDWTAEQIAKGVTDAINRIRNQLEKSTHLSRNFTLLAEQIAGLLPYIAHRSAQKEIDQLFIRKSERETLNAKIDSEYGKTVQRLQRRINDFFYSKLINTLYRKIDPHPEFKNVEFVCEFREGEKPRLNVLVSDQQGQSISPNLYFSAAQINILSLSIFLARALHIKAKGKDVGCIFIDDPIHSMDSINVLSTIDLLRTISKKFNRQIILSTHDKNFFELLKKKIPEQQYSAKFIELETFGRVLTQQA